MIRGLNIAAPPSLLTGWAPPRGRGPPLGAPRRFRTGQARPAPRLARREEVWWAGCSARAGRVPGAARRSCGANLVGASDLGVPPYRLGAGLGGASPRLRLAEAKLECVGTTFCSRNHSGALRRLDFEVPRGIPGGSFSSPEELPGPCPGDSEIRAWEGGGRRWRDTRKSGF